MGSFSNWGMETDISKFSSAPKIEANAYFRARNTDSDGTNHGEPNLDVTNPSFLKSMDILAA